MTINESKKIFFDQLDADYHLSRADISSDVVIVGAEKYGEKARKYLLGAPFLDMINFDGKLIVSVDEAIMPFIVKYISAHGEAFRVFDAPDVFLLNDELHKYGYAVGNMLQGYLLGDTAPRTEYDGDVRIYRGREIEKLYVNKNYRHAFCYTTTDRRRDEIAAVIFGGDSGEIAAVAACSNDGECRWQIGVDVKAEYRLKGLGTRVVRALAIETEKLGYCPYYCCAWSNVASMRTARTAGFVPCWVELSALPVGGEVIRGVREKINGNGNANDRK